MVGLYAGSYYRYGQFGDFGDQRVPWVVPKYHDAGGGLCRITNYPETEQKYMITEWNDPHPKHHYECWVPLPLSREEAWYVSVSFASTVGGSYTPLSDPARVLVATQMATDLMVLVMLAGILLGVVRPDKGDELTTGRLVQAMEAWGVAPTKLEDVKKVLGVD